MNLSTWHKRPYLEISYRHESQMLSENQALTWTVDVGAVDKLGGVAEAHRGLPG